MTLLQDHVFFPFPPLWQNRPQIRRLWKSNVAESATGVEGRTSMIPKPRHALRWDVLPLDHEERTALVDAVMAAKKSGLAAAPFWGRASRLAAPASGNTLTLASAGAWPWGNGDPVFLMANGDWELATVQSVSAGVLALAAPLSRTYEDLAWPVLFGVFTCGDLAWLTGTHGQITLEIEQRSPFAEPVSAPPDTIDFDGVYDTFEGYSEGPASGLNRGSGWDGPWEISSLRFNTEQARDELEGYAEGVNVHGLNGGEGWGGPWQVL